MGYVLIQVPRHVVDSLFSFTLHTLLWFHAYYPPPSAKYFTTAYQLQDNSPLLDSTPSTQTIAYPHVLRVTSNTISTNHGDSWEHMVVSCQAFQVNISKDSASTDITVSSTVLASYPLIIQSS